MERGPGIDLIVKERRRQVAAEGFTASHDDAYGAGELVAAAICYASHDPADGMAVPASWPWDAAWWKPRDRVSNMVRAAALLAAEIDRLNRVDLARRIRDEGCRMQAGFLHNSCATCGRDDVDWSGCPNRQRAR